MNTRPAYREQLDDIATRMFEQFGMTGRIPARKIEAYEAWEKTLTRARADEILDELSEDGADLDECGNGETFADRLWGEIESWQWDALPACRKQS